MFPVGLFVRKPSVDYARRMSNHVAASLMVFAILQIIVVARMGGPVLMHLGIFVAIGGFSIAARALENRWTDTARRAENPDQTRFLFRADLLPLWATAIVAPFLWIPVAIAGARLFS